MPIGFPPVPPGTPPRRLTHVRLYKYEKIFDSNGHHDGIIMLHEWDELHINQYGSNVGAYGVLPMFYMTLDFGQYLGDLLTNTDGLNGERAIFYLIFSCIFEEQEGSPLEYFMFPKGQEEGSIGWNGGAESHSFFIQSNDQPGGITGSCTAACIYPNTTGMVQPFYIPESTRPEQQN